MNDVGDLASQVNIAGFTMPWRIFTNEYWSPTKVNNGTHALKYTRQPNDNSFFELLLKIDSKDYNTNHGSLRDTTTLFPIFGSGENSFYANEAPIGFFGGPVFSIEGRLAFGGAISTSRDFSKVKSYSLKADYVKQMNKNNQIKTGTEIVVTDLDLEFGSQNEFLPSETIGQNQNKAHAAFYVRAE